MYNDGVKKQNELRELYESLRKETSQKRNIYDTLMFQLNKEARIAVNVGEEGIKSYQERWVLSSVAYSGATRTIFLFFGRSYT